MSPPDRYATRQVREATSDPTRDPARNRILGRCTYRRNGPVSREHETKPYRLLRTKLPIIDFDKCTHCMICWVMCPDSCFKTAEGSLLSVDLDHCKGCGICATECPVKCIEMVPEERD